MLATVDVTLLGMPSGLPPLLTTRRVPAAQMTALILACSAALPATICSARTSVLQLASDA
ncbi:MAG: hypothetical protein K6T86_09205 [Pirellulales bacterium]|nr:hypothetical protein [Pirellulales bacterium]